MRRIVVLEHISLDGVIQAPGGPDEDTDSGFAYGGWISPYSDPLLGTALRKQMNSTFDLLLGRKTYDIWAPYWPHHADIWQGVKAATKYVASRSRTSGAWQPAVFLNGDIAARVAEIKQQPGPDLHVWGSSDLLQTLLRHDLVHVFWLMVYPLALGAGKRLFAEGTMPVAFTLTESLVSSKGVIAATYARAGALTTAGG